MIRDPTRRTALTWPAVVAGLVVAAPHLLSSASAAGFPRERCLLAIGDSITQAPDSFVHGHPGWRTVNIALGGSSAFHWTGMVRFPIGDEDLSRRLDTVDCEPDVVSILLGTNDASYWDTPGTPPAWYGIFMGLLIDDVQARWPETRVMLHMPPMRFAGVAKLTASVHRIHRYLDDYRSELRSLAEERKHVCIGVDFRPRVPMAQLSDGIHPGPEAKQIMFEAFARRLFWYRWCR